MVIEEAVIVEVSRNRYIENLLQLMGGSPEKKELM